jgi:hypothetical protein
MHRSPPPHRRFKFAALALAAAMQAAHAEPATLWQCWLEDQSTTLVCAQDGHVIEALFDDPILQHGASNDGVPDRRAILHAGSVTAALRAQPALAVARPVVWRTPLFSPAHDDEFTALLARSVMCGRQPNCRALFRPGAPALEARSEPEAMQLAGGVAR